MKKIEGLVAVAGMSGLFRVVNTKNNGLIVTSLDGGKNRFLSSRSHQFSPLEGIAIYTWTDAIPLEDVFEKMNAFPPDDDLDRTEYRAYFKEIIPDHNEDKVFLSDIKKVIAWYRILESKGYFVGGGEEE